MEGYLTWLIVAQGVSIAALVILSVRITLVKDQVETLRGRRDNIFEKPEEKVEKLEERVEKLEKLEKRVEGLEDLVDDTRRELFYEVVYREGRECFLFAKRSFSRKRWQKRWEKEWDTGYEGKPLSAGFVWDNKKLVGYWDGGQFVEGNVPDELVKVYAEALEFRGE